MFIKNLYRDEIRDGYLVKSDMKKVWEHYLNMWSQIDKICRKHGLTYWAYYGTLIGAARHGGYIPWDDDVDLCMMRPDFNRFHALLKDELAGTSLEIKNNFLSLVQIGDSFTTKIDRSFFRGRPQGMSLAVFALDVAPDGTPAGLASYNALSEVCAAIHDLSQIESHVQNDGRLINKFDFLKEISESHKNDVQFFWDYAEKIFEQSSYVESFEATIRQNKMLPCRKEWFRETIYLPFETIELPAPIGYDEVLTAIYGDWRTPVNDGQNHLGILHSTDIPWREFLRLVDVQKFLQKELQPNKI